MNRLLVLVFILSSTLSYSQPGFGHYFERFGVSEGPCPNDSSRQVLLLDGWETYQTEDDSAEGQRLNTCISYETDEAESVFLSPSEIDVFKPVFFKKRNQAINIKENSVYMLQTYISKNEGRFPDCGALGNNDCYSFEFNISNHHQGEKQDDSSLLFTNTKFFNDDKVLTFYDCVLSNKLDSQLITSITMKMYVGDFKGDDRINMNIFVLEWNEQINKFNDNNIVNNQFFQDSQYIVPSNILSENPSLSNQVALHDTEGVPSIDNIHYYNIKPENNFEQKKIVIRVLNDHFFRIQPFTQIRGALVEGEDSIRHQVELMNHGGEVCLAWDVELTFEDEDIFSYQSGNINFNSHFSCMQFRDQAKMVIKENARLHYGKLGKGLLNLKSGASIVIEEGGELYFDGTMVLSDHETTDPITLELKPNRKLSFSPHAFIDAKAPEYEYKQLDIYMKGGALDISQLSDESKAHLNIIYDKVYYPSDEFFISPNPSNHFITVNSDFETNEEVSIYNNSGQKVRSIMLTSESQNIDISKLGTGLYYIIGNDQRMGKFVKIP